VMRSGAGRVQTFHFEGDRSAVRQQAVVTALRGVLEIIEEDTLLA